MKLRTEPKTTYFFCSRINMRILIKGLRITLSSETLQKLKVVTCKHFDAELPKTVTVPKVKLSMTGDRLDPKPCVLISNLNTNDLDAYLHEIYESDSFKDYETAMQEEAMTDFAINHQNDTGKIPVKHK